MLKKLLRARTAFYFVRTAGQTTQGSVRECGTEIRQLTRSLRAGPDHRRHDLLIHLGSLLDNMTTITLALD
jgi:hypothetical protein